VTLGVLESHRDVPELGHLPARPRGDELSHRAHQRIITLFQEVERRDRFDADRRIELDRGSCREVRERAALGGDQEQAIEDADIIECKAAVVIGRGIADVGADRERRLYVGVDLIYRDRRLA